MSQTAKLFINGRSQALRLPVAYRFDAKEVFIRRDPSTGDVILACALCNNLMLITRNTKDFAASDWPNIRVPYSLS